MVPAADLPFMLREGLRVWLVPPPVGVREGVIEHVRSGPKGPLVKITGIDDPDTARSLRGVALSVPSTRCRLLWPRSLSTRSACMSRRRMELTSDSIEEVIVTGANDVWVVDGGAYGEVLLPVIDDVVLDLDEDARTVTVHLLEGLVDEEATR